NNANVLLWKALGPHPEGATMPAEFFKLMGIEAPPEKGDYFIDLSRFLKEHPELDPAEEDEQIREKLWPVTQRPLTPKDYAELAAWLRANEKPLAVALEATKRSRYLSPLVLSRADNEPSLLVGVLMPGVQACRDIGSALVTRAMLHVGEGTFEA